MATRKKTTIVTRGKGLRVKVGAKF